MSSLNRFSFSSIWVVKTLPVVTNNLYVVFEVAKLKGNSRHHVIIGADYLQESSTRSDDDNEEDY